MYTAEEHVYKTGLLVGEPSLHITTIIFPFNFHKLNQLNSLQCPIWVKYAKNQEIILIAKYI